VIVEHKNHRDHVEKYRIIVHREHFVHVHRLVYIVQQNYEVLMKLVVDFQDNIHCPLHREVVEQFEDVIKEFEAALKANKLQMEDQQMIITSYSRQLSELHHVNRESNTNSLRAKYELEKAQRELTNLRCASENHTAVISNLNTELQKIKDELLVLKSKDSHKKQTIGTPIKIDDCSEIQKVHKSLRRTTSVVAESPHKQEEYKSIAISKCQENSGDIANTEVVKNIAEKHASKRRTTFVVPTVPTITNGTSPQKPKVIRNLSSDLGISPVKKSRLSSAFASKTDRFS